MKTIDTLVEDIYDLLKNGSDTIDDSVFEEFGKSMASLLKRRLSTEAHKPALRMSNIGSPCSRKLWFEINQPEAREEMDGATHFKFLFGDIIEEVTLTLAKASGHTIEGQQDEQEIAGVKGHRDAVIDGMLVDVKSASKYSFNKFKDGKLKDDDPFGYITQLQSYLYSSQDDDKVTVKDKAAFLVVSKELGHICLDVHDKEDWDLTEAYERRKSQINSGDVPDRSFQPVPDGKSGNMKLDTFCSYCSVKSACHPNLRTFLYSTGPRYLTTVAKVPDVYEVTNEEA